MVKYISKSSFSFSKRATQKGEVPEGAEGLGAWAAINLLNQVGLIRSGLAVQLLY